jgi:DNA-binding NarL/FixJ family response regulator
MITITVISKYEHDRKALAAALLDQEDFCVVSIGIDGYDALKAAKTQQPDIIIMDFSMDDVGCLEIAPIIKRHSPSTGMIVLCSPDEAFFDKNENILAQALKAGISGYLLKQKDIDSLPISIRSVFHGGLYISKSIRLHALHCFSVPTEVFPIGVDASNFSFTPTEQGIFYGITCGRTDREIAKDLNMRIGSVRNCVNRVKNRTGLKNRTQISIYALSAGIINIGKIKESFFMGNL